ncbi:S26 family signal peptidase [Patescibacteria group bacterium]|nr:S26 family signal peptidase [Patescibacteria group bacterium]
MIFFKIFKVEGTSMHPTIYNRNKILVSYIPYLFKNPKINDIIVAKHPYKNIYIVKRITKIEKGGYFIEGDYILSSDSKEFNMIPKKLILAKLLFIF